MKTVIEMALSVVPEKDREDAQGYKFLLLTYSELESLAKLVRADEREALEKLDWTAIMREGGLVTWGDASCLGDRVFAAIRSRGQA